MPHPTPEFCARCTAVLNGPYFSSAFRGLDIPDDDIDAVIALTERVSDEREAFVKAVSDCRDYDDLTADGKKLFDRAEEALHNFQADQDVHARLYEDTGVVSVLPGEGGDGEKGGDGDGPLTADETGQLTAALFMARAQGDEAAVTALGGLASDPARARRVMSGREGEGGRGGAGSKGGDGDEEDEPAPSRYAAEWDEARHPRDAGGRFATVAASGRAMADRIESAIAPHLSAVDEAKTAYAAGLAACKAALLPRATMADMDRAREQRDVAKKALDEANARALAIRHAALHEAFGLPEGDRRRLEATVDKSAEGTAVEKNWGSAREFLGPLLGRRKADDITRVGVKRSDRRAFYDGGWLNTEATDDPGIVVHEFGHHLEQEPWVRERVKAFRTKRFDPAADEYLSDRFPDAKFDRAETGNPDDMEKLFGKGNANAWYCGKSYGGGDTEIVSLGLELLYRNPERFAREDPEYFGLIIDVLQGDRG